MTPEIVAEHGLSADEYARLLAILGREPNMVELGIASAMWSEHCSYKSSRAWLATLPTEAPWVICGPGENAGVVDIGEGKAAVFKIESHNHPSFIEPYQGAATGVGGILRDVFTMGARPVAVLDALRFGSPDHPRTRHLVSGVVSGIGGYGNCIGIPTVGGETEFDAAYDGNILVNAMAVGIADADRIFYARATGVGNAVVYVGSKTGRDGIHGATMASATFDADAEAAADGPGRRSVHRKASAGSLPRADGDRRDRRDPGHGSGRADIVRARNGVEGRRRGRPRPRPRANPRNRHERLRDHALGEPGADADGAPSRRRSGGRARIPQVGSRFRGHRQADRHRPRRALARWRDRRRHSGGSAGRGGAPLSAAPCPDAGARDAGDRHGRGRAPRSARTAHGLARSGVAALDLGAVRPHGDGRHGGQAGRRRGGDPRPRHVAGDRAHHRLHAALLRRRPAGGRAPGGGGGLAQPRRGGRAAARGNRQPQFRRSRAARDHGPAGRLHRRHRRGLPRPRLPRGLGQCVALQRDRRAGDPADTGDRRARAP